MKKTLFLLIVGLIIFSMATLDSQAAKQAKKGGAVSQQEITDMSTNIDMKTRNVDIDFAQLKLAIISEGVKEPSFRDRATLEHFGVSTPYDLIKLMLTSGERDALYNEIQELSGYNAEVIKDIKKQ
jgi:hypothetical protein